MAESGTDEPSDKMSTSDKISSAVAFLTHPKVQESTEASKRSFLESKGLSKDEIDEAFRLAGASKTGAKSAGPAAPAQVQSTYQQPSPPIAAPVAKPQPVRWTQVVLGAGVAAGGAYIAKKAFEGYATKFFQSITSSSARNGDAASEKQTEEVNKMVSDLKLQTNELKASVDSLKQMFLDLEGSVSDYKTAAGNQDEVSELRDELRTLTSTINMFASPEKQAYEETLKDELSAIKTILSDLNTPKKERDGAPSQSGFPGQASGYPLEYIGSTSPSSKLRGPNGANNGVEDIGAGNGGARSNLEETSGGANGAGASDDPPRPHSYMEILEMLEKNQTPPGIRTDIDDKVKVADQDPTASSSENPPTKPWQRGNGWTPPPVPMSRLTSPMPSEDAAAAAAAGGSSSSMAGQGTSSSWAR